MQINKVPISIITGFLGSGKTTIISELLKNTQGKKIAVIVNEFGDIGIDGELIKSSCGCEEGNIIELNNGCLCCTVQEEFLPTMVKLMERKHEIDHIVIETSGLALPKPLLRAVNWPALKSQVTINAVITVVDAVGQATGEICDRNKVQAQRAADDSIDHESTIEELFLDQLSCADLVLLTKTDIVDTPKIAEIKQILGQKLRKNIKVIECQKGSLPVGILFGINAAAEEDVDKRLTLHEKHHHGPDNEGHHHHDHDHDDGIHSVIIPVNDKVSLDKLMQNIDVAMADFEIYRIKGFLNIENKPMRMVLQGVGHRFDHYFDRLWQPEEKRASRLVVIGRDLQQAKIEKILSTT